MTVKRHGQYKQTGTLFKLNSNKSISNLVEVLENEHLLAYTIHIAFDHLRTESLDFLLNYILNRKFSKAYNLVRIKIKLLELGFYYSPLKRTW